MNYYRRNLPHWQPEGADYFITFRLAGSLPKQAVIDLRRRKEQWEKMLEKQEPDSRTPGCQPRRQQDLQDRIQQKIFQTYEQHLDTGKAGPHWLKQPDIGRIVEEAEKGKAPVTKILMSLKRYTACECKKILNRTGAFWQPESYDHLIRNQDELERIIAYSLNNPVKAG